MRQTRRYSDSSSWVSVALCDTVRSLSSAPLRVSSKASLTVHTQTSLCITRKLRTFWAFNLTAGIAVGLFRPPDIICRRTYVLAGILSFFFLSSFFRRLISELTEPNSTKISHMVGTKCNLKTHVRNLGCLFPLQIGPENHLFWPTSLLNGNFNDLYHWNKTWYRQLVKCVDNCEGSPISSQNGMNFGLQTA